MHNEFTALIEKHDEWYVGSCPEILEANGQGKTVEDCRQNLTDAISLVLLDRREDALRDAAKDVLREICDRRCVNREALLRHLRSHGCTLKREGGSPSILVSPQGKMQAVPRHNEVVDFLARAICRKLDLPDPGKRDR